MVLCSIFFAILSTTHMVTNVIHAVRGLIQFRDAPGGSEAYFSDLSQFTFVFKTLVYLIAAVFGDAIVIYRCYMVWQSWWLAIFPGIMVAGVAATGIVGLYYVSSFNPLDLSSYEPIEKWITAFYSVTLTTNFSCTALLAYRIWNINNSVKKYRMGRGVPVLMIIVDSGLVYAIVHFLTLVCWVMKNSSSYILVDMVRLSSPTPSYVVCPDLRLLDNVCMHLILQAQPCIAISFYMVIIRIGLANSSSVYARSTLAEDIVSGIGAIGSQGLTYSLRPLEVHITQLTESNKPPDQYPKIEESAHDVERGHGRSEFEAETDLSGRGLQA
ncbi:hypothetical protein EW146_g1987 [Bondarzewia mesenterica]|uniref:Uncharacterized protein n=1 Tax=Bondarzewia mesenterica TaxID=1095465 RepID=A0A4S4M3L1_9AGAM|nr:hypothetical protein EW146_g1987 [Bondarzewia mesenterica]